MRRRLMIEMIIRYDKERRRVWVFKARIHHGLVGLFLMILGFMLILDDLHDFPWLRDTL